MILQEANLPADTTEENSKYSSFLLSHASFPLAAIPGSPCILPQTLVRALGLAVQTVVLMPAAAAVKRQNLTLHHRPSEFAL